MKTRTLTSLFGIFVLCLSAPLLSAGVDEAAPVTVAQATKRIGEQGLTDQAMDYQGAFLESVGKKLRNSITDGIAAKGKGSCDLYFVVGVDGRISNVIVEEPEKYPLGKFVAARMLGVQAVKPPRPDWVVYLSNEH